jgi:hypothetical protein
MDRCILGIDPGVSGALAFFFTERPERVAVEDTPVADGEVNVAGVAALIRQYAPTVAVIERVHAFRGASSSSSFRFGRAYGDVRGAVSALGVPVHFVMPAVWKKHFKLSQDKEKSRAMALQLFPACAASFARKSDDGRAEAALIAKYGAETLFPWSAAA